MDMMSNGNGGRGGRRRSNLRSLGSAQLPARGRGGGRSRGGGRARGRIGRGLSQAAEALLGMGGEFDQDENMTVCMRDEIAAACHAWLRTSGVCIVQFCMSWMSCRCVLNVELFQQDVVISEDDEGMYACEQASPYPSGSFRPGRVIWAKVEGHDWWPARVVRRRAVPREVGPPPGGPSRVRTHIPVVFFTAKGIPGEVGDDAHKLGGTQPGQCLFSSPFLVQSALTTILAPI
jgi:hypothetical protein